MLFDGDSMTTGYGLVSPFSQSYPAQVVALYGWNYWKLKNFGVPSQTTQDMINDAVATIDPLQGQCSKNVLMALCGSNDLYFGATPAATYNLISTYHTARRAAGFKTVAFTILPRSNPGTPPTFEADRQTVNTNIRANWSTWADALADVAGDNRIGDAGDELNGTYYQDAVHLTAAGYAIVAAIAKAAADSL